VRNTPPHRSALLLVGIILLWLASCTASSNRKLQSDLQKTLQVSADGTVLHLSAITQFKWEKVFIFGPYTSRRAIEQALGFHWASPVVKEIESSDSFELLIFVRNGRVVQYARVQRRSADWDISDQNGFTPSESSFLVRRPSAGDGITLKRVGSFKG